MSQNRNQFIWKEYDLNSILKDGWDKEIVAVAKKFAEYKILHPNSVTSRESPNVKEIPTLTVEGNVIKRELPWLYELYETVFYEHGVENVSESLHLAENPLYAINLNVQKGRKMRYECHIDSNPLQGVFYATTHKEGDGGELVVSNLSDAVGIEQIEKDCEILRPKKGVLCLFNSYYNPHYVRPLTNENAIRVSCPMNFYTDSSPESARPKDLTNHLF